MFFGLTNSPAMFQTMMNEIFKDLVMEGVVCIYIDDILIFMKTLEEHRRVTKIVLEHLCEHKLYLKPEKCEFEKTQIKYLGVIISHGQVEMDPVKIAGVAQWPQLCNRKELPWVCKLLLPFYSQFLASCAATVQLDKERRAVELGGGGTAVV